MSTSGKISGYVYDEYGKFSVKVTATNLAKTVRKNLKLNVLATPSMGNYYYNLPSGTVGKSYKYKFNNVTGSKPITFRLYGGQLPPGITLDAKSGKLSGKPTTAGFFEFSITAVNSVGEGGVDCGVTITNKDGTISSETSSAAPSDKSALKEGLPAENETSQTQEAYPESESESVTAEGEGCDIVAVLPEVSVDVSGMYDFADVVLDDKAEIGAVLVWLANSGEPTSDDNIAEFSDEDGREIECVPENRKVNVSAWLNAGKTYKPAVAVRR